MTGEAASHPPRLISDYLAGKKVSEQEFRRPHQHHLTSINSEIDRPDDDVGNVLIARQILGNQQAKIRWGLLTPWRRGVPIWLANPWDVFKLWGPFGPQHSRLPEIHLQCTIVLVFDQYELRPLLSPGLLLPFGPQRVRGASHRRWSGVVYKIWLPNIGRCLEKVPRWPSVL